MKLDINRYIRYCLFLFDSCTVNGLGTFQIIQSPPRLDHNGNYIQDEKYTITFTNNHTEKPRLAYLLSSKENCTEEYAEQSIRQYVKNILEEIAVKNEVWFRELGMLIQKNGELRFLSHKFTSKELKQQVATQTSLPHTNVPVKPAPSFTDTAIAGHFEHNNHTTDTDNILEKSFDYSDVLTPLLPTVPVAKNNNRQQVEENAEEEVAVAAVIPAFQTNHIDTALVNTENKLAKKAAFQLSAKTKKGIVYGLAIAGCLVTSYLIYSFLSSTSNAPDPKYTMAATGATTANENNVPSLLTAEIKPDDKTNYSKNAVYTVPAAPVKNTNQAQAKTVKDKAKSNDDIKLAEQENATLPNNYQYGTTGKIAPEKEPPVPVQTLVPLTSNSGTAVQLKPAVAKINITEPSNIIVKPELMVDAEFPGGKNKLAKFLTQKLIYPDSGIEDGIEGVSTVKIRVDKNGDVKATEIINSLGPDFDKEIRRVLKQMPQWSPAKVNGEPVEASYNFKVHFTNINKSLRK
jgi:TonB family protein